MFKTRLGLTIGASLFLGACGDAGVATTGPADAAATAQPAVLVVATMQGDTAFATFEVAPDEATVLSIPGGHWVTFPANVICDPADGYGPEYWDAPCRRVASPVRISVKSWHDEAGHARVEFQPALRFAPSRRLREQVWLHLRDVAGSADPTSTILYCPDGGAECYDESLLDPSLRTRRAGPGGEHVWRRIKHFSGYVVAAGRLELDAEL